MTHRWALVVHQLQNVITLASWWRRWRLFLIKSRKRGEGGVVIEGTSLIVAAISPCWICMVICLQCVRDIQITSAFIFQGQRMHKKLDNCSWDLKLWSQKEPFSFVFVSFILAMTHSEEVDFTLVTHYVWVWKYILRACLYRTQLSDEMIKI